ncbi:hypothetical protein LshimejAT787_2200800 [Lyophyllum shimeji]|uniref:Uncharacterized protein n=1 Tax=Lyophyllum shimeji TaxID=47721 RepID=A0A9P3UUR4_LYOSH|nr:hypothetical protein LshimejAT787_2200800 [Lyophyllum shimeji]
MRRDIFVHLRFSTAAAPPCSPSSRFPPSTSALQHDPPPPLLLIASFPSSTSSTSTRSLAYQYRPSRSPTPGRARDTGDVGVPLFLLGGRCERRSAGPISPPASTRRAGEAQLHVRHPAELAYAVVEREQRERFGRGDFEARAKPLLDDASVLHDVHEVARLGLREVVCDDDGGLVAAPGAEGSEDEEVSNAEEA